MPATLPTGHTAPQVAAAAVPQNALPQLDWRVDEAGIDSFPASDPPGWWAGTMARNSGGKEDNDASDT